MQSSYREVLRCLLEGIQWLLEPSARIEVAGNSGISQARTRLRWEPLLRRSGKLTHLICCALHITRYAEFENMRSLTRGIRFP